MMLVLAIVMVLCFVINVPIAISLVVATAAALLSSGNSNMMVVPQHMVAGVDSFALLAIPFFMMAGTVMDRGVFQSELSIWQTDLSVILKVDLEMSLLFPAHFLLQFLAPLLPLQPLSAE